MSKPDQIFTANCSYNTDNCAVETREKQNTAISSYELYNSQLVPCNSATAMRSPDCQYDHINLRANIGYGVSDSCTIDQYSLLRNDPHQMTRDRCHQQLFTRVFYDGPNLKPGIPDPITELELLEGGYSSTQNNGVDLPCKRTITVDGPKWFYPLIDCIKTEVQNPAHIVPPWINGGEPTRDFVRRQEFLNTCGYNVRPNVTRNPPPAKNNRAAY